MTQTEGAVIGDRYRLVRKIGEGGMATVWEAEHVALGNMLAVKFLHRTAPKGSETAERFLREARVAAQVKHRNVVEINDFGFTDDHVPYMVMERLKGQPLADYLLLRGPLEFDDAARLVSLTLRGLAAVHDAGIVHRDLKPDNIFLVHDEEGLFPKLLDFGLSRPAGRSKMTMEGTLMGTPDYMSPEQARGLSDIDARTDIYSMGVILYEMLAGRMPYESENVGDLLAMIARDPAPPVTDSRPDAPPELVAVIERAMSKDRDDRFSEAREMRSALVDTWGGFQEPLSGLTSLSEMPPAPSDGSGLLGRISRTPSGPLRRPRTGSGLAPNPALHRTGSGVGPNPALARPSVSRGAETIDEPPASPGNTLEHAERRSIEDAPTLAGMPAASYGPGTTIPGRSDARQPAPAEGPRSLLTTVLAISLAAAAASTFAFVWIARGGGEQAANETFGGMPMLGAFMDDPDAGLDAGVPEYDAGIDAGAPGDAGIAEEPQPTKRTAKRRGGRRRPTKRTRRAR